MRGGIWLAALTLILGCSGGSGTAEEGELGGDCYGNGSCNAGLSCEGETCVQAVGDEGGPCYGNGTCNDGLDCIADICSSSGTTIDAATADASDLGFDASDVVETMAITFTTTPVGGTYAPTNIVATWIEDDVGNFIQTIDRQASVRVQHLIAWNEQAGADQDAITGATRLNHNTPITAAWNLQESSVPDGTYTIRIETADDNSATADQNHQGSFTFEKDGTASSQTTSGNGYVDVSIDYSGR